MTRFLFGFRLVVVVGLVIVANGCDRRAATPAGDGEVPPPAPGGALPCFPEAGPVAFTVNGVPVPERTIDRFAAFYRDLGAQNPDLSKARAIDEAILMTAAVYASFRDEGRLDEWTSRVKAADARIKGGEDFASLARTSSDCPTKEQGGDLGAPFRRDQNLAPLTETSFRLQVGEVGDPVVTAYGAHFLKVTGKVDGSSPEKDQRKAAHVLIAFDPEAIRDVPTYLQKCQKLKKEARVESVREPYKKLIPASHRR